MLLEFPCGPKDGVEHVDGDVGGDEEGDDLGDDDVDEGAGDMDAAAVLCEAYDPF